MTETVTITVDRTGLSLSALTIDSSTTGTYTLAEGGLGRVGVSRREQFADDSPWVNGRLRVAVAKNEEPLNLIVRVQSTTSSGLATAVTALETALGQFSYTVTVDIDGVSKTRAASPATIGALDGQVVPWAVAGFYEHLNISIPVDPVAS